MLLRDFIGESVASLERLYPAPEARNIVMILCQTLLGVKSYTHITEPQTCIPPDLQAALDSAMKRLLAAEPLQYVLGSASFYGREFHVTPSVLIPRPETELLVSCALSRLREEPPSSASSCSSAYLDKTLTTTSSHCEKVSSASSCSSAYLDKTLVSASFRLEKPSNAPSLPEKPSVNSSSSYHREADSDAQNIKRRGARRVLDLCTGSGCIAWTIALEMPDTEVLAVDISQAALDIAKSQKFQASPPPCFIKADILDTEQAFDHGSFDIILSNPPYIMNKEKSSMRANVLDYEPGLALFVDDADPLIFYRAAARWAQRFLAPGGSAFFEINERLAEQTAASILSFGFQKLQIFRDFANKFRIVSFSKPL